MALLLFGACMLAAAGFVLGVWVGLAVTGVEAMLAGYSVLYAENRHA